MSYKGPTTVNSTQCILVTFSISIPSGTSLVVQSWFFDAATNLPLRVEFRLPAEVGSSMSPTGIIDVADYHSVSGIMYPFFIGVLAQGNLPEIIAIQSVTPGLSAPLPEFNSSAGDVGR
jgi:hypothetical protein